jgi:tetratricopeptide (TPR) repeat protein
MHRLKASCLGILAAVAAFAVLAARDAGAEDLFSTLTEDTCWVDTPTTDKALKSKQYKQAIAGYTKAIDWTAKTCGQTLAAKQRLASEELKKSHLGRAIAAAGQGDYDLAARDVALLLEADFEELWKIRPHIRALSDNKAMSEPSEAAFLDWALGIVNEAIERKPKTSVYYAARGDIYDTREEFQKALADRDAQVEYARNNAEKAKAYYDRAFTRYRLGDKEGELADLNSGIELDPEPEPRRYGDRASLKKGFGQIDEAIADYTKAMSDEKYFRYKDYLKARADLYRESGKLDAAADDYQKALSKWPKDVESLYGLLLVRTQQGDDRQAKRLRAQLDKLKPGYLDKPERARELAEVGVGPAEPAVSPEALREAWTMGEVVALAPLQHLIGKPNPTIDKAWDMTSKLVATEQKAAGQPPRGLGKIPAFKGSNSAQLKQTVAYVFRQSKAVEAALVKKFGKRAGAVFAVSNAGYLAMTLNQMGVPNVNTQLGRIIKAQGPSSGLPRDVWADTVTKTESNAKPEEVAKAWDAGRKAARAFLATPEPAPDKKSEAQPVKQTPKQEKAAEKKSATAPALPSCDDEYLLYGEFDPNSMPPCQR